jgi:DNA mismatch repair protein MutS
VHSPIRSQYLQIKRQYPDTLLFFRLGDFYETFDEDAEIVARELEIALTRRDFGRGERTPMAGVPHHAADGYIARLVSKGFKVAVCEQMSTPGLGAGLVEREVVRVVTPGTVTDPAMLADKRNNYLAAAVVGRGAVGLAYVDITTGEFATTQFSADDPEQALAQELARVGPAEVLVARDAGRAGWRGWPRVRAARRVGALGINAQGRDGEILDSEDEGIGGDPGPQRPGHGAAGMNRGPGDEADDDGLPGWVRRLNGFIKNLTPFDARSFQEEQARARLMEHFAVASLDGFGCGRLPLAVSTAGAVLAYLQETQRGVLRQLVALETYSTAQFMAMDAYTRRNLEIFESGRGGGIKGSLLWVLDHTRTPMGGRLLRRWLGEPLLDVAALTRRQDAVAAAVAAMAVRARLATLLGRIGDIERLANRVIQRQATPRELVALAEGLRTVAEVRSEAESGDAFRGLLARVDSCTDVVALVDEAIVDEPPLTLSDGGVIRPGYSEELDHIIDSSRHAREWVANLEQVERERTGINSLKVGYNKVFGYFIEVSNSHTTRVPADYIRKQTLTTGERYITPELKEYEALILNAQEKTTRLEAELFAELRATIAISAGERLLATARLLAEIDVYLSLAEVAAERRYCRPTLCAPASERPGSGALGPEGPEHGTRSPKDLADSSSRAPVIDGREDSDRIHIVAGRHPVVEPALSDTPFVPNDTDIATGDAQILIITGPNMAGKSTYLRQVALIVLMAQIGSFVPAEAATIGLVDRIFTRIGAQDDLATGQSTFMVEMVETANILHHATPRSLVVLDEIGRGTSTYDGLAIARAVVEYLHNNRRCGAKTLFATHYHELVEVAHLLPRVRCYTIAVTEEEGHVVFLRKIIPGGADRSYGIHVAQLAGIPRPVINRAQEILAELERKGEAKGRRKLMKEMTMPPALQLTLFAATEPNPLVEMLRELRVDELTPLEAISKLYELQQKARELE